MQAVANFRAWRGARLLDRRGPLNWRAHVDVRRLDINSGSYCVLGQVYGGYGIGLDHLYRDPLQITSGMRHGFCAAVWASNAELVRAWQRLLPPPVPLPFPDYDS